MNSLPKTVTLQRRDCDLNPVTFCASTLTTRLPMTDDICYSGGGSNLKVGGHMASAEREPIRGSGGGVRRPGLTLDSFRQSLKTHLFGDRSA